MLVRWREDDDLEEIALLICISESLDVDLNLKQVLAQLQRQVAKGAAVAKADKVVNKKRIDVAGWHLKPSKHSNANIKRKKVTTLEGLERFMHSSRIEEFFIKFSIK